MYIYTPLAVFTSIHVPSQLKWKHIVTLQKANNQPINSWSVACLSVCLYIYSAGTDHGYRCTGRRVVGLVQLLEGTIKALNCLCAHYTVLKVVPINYSLWKEWIFPSVCLKLDEFEGSRVVHYLSIYYVWCFKSFVLFGFPLSFVPYFFQIVFWCDGGHQSLNHFVKHS